MSRTLAPLPALVGATAKEVRAALAALAARREIRWTRCRELSHVEVCTR